MSTINFRTFRQAGRISHEEKLQGQENYGPLFSNASFTSRFRALEGKGVGAVIFRTSEAKWSHIECVLEPLVHTPSVSGVCRRLLNHPPDSEYSRC
jgi:hypothetical protein